MPKVIGLTGGIASGKSTVANMIRNYKLPLIDSDAIAKEVMAQESVLQDLKHTFGTSIFDAQQKLSRKALAQIIYDDEDARKQLNEIVHPLVRQEILKRIKQNYKEEQLVFVDVPLLYESGFDQMMDQTIVVYVPKEIQLRRLTRRDSIDESYATKKIQAQDPLDTKKDKADFVIDNAHSIEYTEKQLRTILEQIEV